MIQYAYPLRLCDYLDTPFTIGKHWICGIVREKSKYENTIDRVLDVDSF